MGPFSYPFGTFSRYFHKNAAKLTKSKKGFKNRVVTTFNAKFTFFGDYFWTFIPNLHHMKMAFNQICWLFLANFRLFLVYFGLYKPFWRQFGTCMPNWDFFGTKFGFWSQLGPSPKFGTSLEGLKMGMQKSHFFPQKHILKISSYCTIRHLLGQ